MTRTEAIARLSDLLGGHRDVAVPDSVRRALVSDREAWPTGPAVSGWRRLVRLGHAEETTGVCAGCRTHAPGAVVPVFTLADGVRLTVRA